MYCKMFFFLHKFFLYIATNTVRAPTEIKQNLLHYSGKTTLLLLSRRIKNKLFRATANIRQSKFMFKEELKLT